MEPIVLDPAADGWCLLRTKTGDLVLAPLRFSAHAEAILSGAQVYAELYDDSEDEGDEDVPEPGQLPWGSVATHYVASATPWQRTITIWRYDRDEGRSHVEATISEVELAEVEGRDQALAGAGWKRVEDWRTEAGGVFFRARVERVGGVS